eukprot:3687449-Rhodomonas_salina.1
MMLPDTSQARTSGCNEPLRLTRTAMTRLCPCPAAHRPSSCPRCVRGRLRCGATSPRLPAHLCSKSHPAVLLPVKACKP